MRLHQSRQPSSKMEELAFRGQDGRTKEVSQDTEPSLGQEGRPTQHRERQGGKGVSREALSFSGEPEGAPGDIIILGQKVEEDMHYGDIIMINLSSSELAPSNTVSSLQVLKQQHQHQPQRQHHHQQQYHHHQQQLELQPQPQMALCKARYNFDPKQLGLEDCKDCLTFLKPNSAAAKLLEGRNKVSDSSDYPPQLGSGNGTKLDRNTADVSNWIAVVGAPQGPAKIPNIHDLPAQAPQAAPPHYISLKRPPRGRPPGLPRPLQPRDPPHNLTSTVQHSGTFLRRVKHCSQHTHRHLSHGERRMNETPPTITMALINPQTSSSSSSADTKLPSSTQQLSISVCAALYSYKPRRPEELELRRGEMVGVYGSFKEGWLRGLSLRTGKVGILPGNYVTPVLRTSARLLESKVASVASGTVPGKRTSGSKGPAVVVALNRVDSEGTSFSAGQATSGSGGRPPMLSSTGAGRMSLNGGSQGWDKVRRAFHSSHRGSAQRGSHYTSSSWGLQAHGYSPTLPRKNHSLLPQPAWMLGRTSDSIAPSAASVVKDRELVGRKASSVPQSILVRPEAGRNHTDKATKSVRFVTQDEPGSVAGEESWKGEVWAPSLTLGRDGPGIFLRDGRVLRTASTDSLTSTQKPSSYAPSSTSQSAASSTQASPCRHRLTSSYRAQTDSELSLTKGELVLVHPHRPDGRVLVTQESSAQTGLFHSSVLHFLERLS
ncbi:E3 ubiquitin-protein ligase SH3RF1 isoform X2 [Hypomesus transpacificus]|uniref:E3 ubiquitin-protein ligase SH3RF1 isoform X2 n=1 Tax=Hypomesus transpacificus TaxID=137520 RepID=UPI001F086836|nr:E3 ubiquitin-protein ligase SH3RF1 isoform X2 [Hypomesus transpacificus]